MIVTDSDSGEARWRAAAGSINARTVAVIGLEQAKDRLAQQVSLDVAIVDLQQDGGVALDRLFETLNQAAVGHRFRSIICAPLSLLDAIDAQTAHPDIAVLCEPDVIEQAGPLSVAMAGTPLMLNDISSDRDEARLLRLSEEVGRIARVLADLSHGDAGSRPVDGRFGSPTSDFRAEPSRSPALSAEDIRTMIRFRRLRERFFENELFADPA